MAEENTDQKKEAAPQGTSGASSVPVPSADSVAEALASFQKTHPHHAAPEIPVVTPKADLGPILVTPPTVTEAPPEAVKEEHTALVVAPVLLPPTLPKTPLQKTTPQKVVPAIPSLPTEMKKQVAEAAPKPDYSMSFGAPEVQKTQNAPITPSIPQPVKSLKVAEFETTTSLQIKPQVVAPTETTPIAIPRPAASTQPTPAAPPTPPSSTPAIPTPTASPNLTVATPPAKETSAPKASLVSQALDAKLPEKPKVVPQAPAAPQTPVVEKLSREDLLKSVEKAPAPAPAQTPQAEAKDQKAKPTIPSLVEEMRSQSSSPLHPLRTLKDDVEASVKEHKTSLVTVAAAEEDRRAKGTPSLTDAEPVEKRKSSWPFIIAALIMLIVGGGALLYAFVPRTAPITGTPQLPASTLISVDETVPFSIDNQNSSTLSKKLVSLRDGTKLSLGLIRELYPQSASSTQTSTRAPVRSIMSILAPHATDDLLRTLDSNYVLGVHVFDGNQAFLILTTSAYEQTFSGMVAWEPAMVADLTPLFDRRPRPRTPEEQLSTSTPPSVMDTGFSDAVVVNYDARVHKDDQGNIVLLWTFVNQNTLVITTNERTLTEIVTRLRHAPTLGQ